VESSSKEDSDTDAYPVILPMLGFTGDFHNPGASPAEPRALYLHGYVSSRIMRMSSAGNKENGNNKDGIPVCVAATLFDGVVLALTPNHHSCNYRSAVVFGRAHIVTDEAERLWAMERTTDNLVPGRWAATRYPNAVEQKSTGILRVDIASASGQDPYRLNRRG
jgi:nitroimidazol reductase NimA-like FMN-containing flavoprotein (pyridoxamine 5'-phosphate oxidase superfamily)